MSIGKKILDIYLAGGMADITYAESNHWRELIDYKLKLFEGVVDITNPNNYFSLVNPYHGSEREIREFDLHRVRHSDLIIVNFNAPQSIGTAQELAVANEHRIPVIGLNESGILLHPWLVDSCNRIFSDMDEMLEYVNDYYIN